MTDLDMNALKALRAKLDAIIEEEKANKEEKVTITKVASSMMETLREKKENLVDSILSKADKAAKRREIEKEVKKKMKGIEDQVRASVEKK